MMNEYWIVKDNKTSKTICVCGDINDAIMMVSFDPHNRVYSRSRFIVDQIIDVTSTTDKQLPGQQGLPAAKYSLSSLDKEDILLPEGNQIPFNAK